jgi:hypothetical protein
MLQLQVIILTPLGFLIAKDSSMKGCYKDLLWRVKEWAIDIQRMQQAGAISYAPTWQGQDTMEITLKAVVNGLVLSLFSSCAPRSFNMQITGCWSGNEPRALEKLRFAARYSTKGCLEILHISMHWSSMRKAFQISGVLIRWSWLLLHTFSSIMLMVYTYWLL